MPDLATTHVSVFRRIERIESRHRHGDDARVCGLNRRLACSLSRPRAVLVAVLAVAVQGIVQPGWALAADEVPGSELCQGPLSRIEFVGNRVTSSQFMLRELALRPGEICSMDRVVDGVQRLLDLDLFKSVRAELVRVVSSEGPDLAAALPVDPGTTAPQPEFVDDSVQAVKLSFEDEPAFGNDGPLDDGLHNALPEDLPPAPEPDIHGHDGSEVELRYIVQEKFYFLGVPRLSRASDGEVRAGLSLQWDNFLGRLHELKITSEWRQEDEGRGRGGFVHGLDYNVPRFLESPYGLGVRFRVESREVDLAQDDVDYGEGRREAQAIGLNLSRWLNRSESVQGLRVFLGSTLEHREYTVALGGLGPLTDGTDLGWSVGLEHRQIHRDRYRRIGHRLGASLRWSSSSFGSDFDWTRFDAWAVRYVPLGSELNNLNVRVSLGISDGAPFGERFYAIGGGDILRGVAKGERDGDVRLLFNVEYLDPWYVRPHLRSVVFLDGGNVWLHDDVDVTDLEWRGGVGLRWKLDSLSKTDLRIDVAWDADKGEVVPYVSTSLTF